MHSSQPLFEGVGCGNRLGETTLRQPSDLYGYQRKAILHQLYNKDSMLWLGMSLGKTIITLSTIEHRMRAGEVKKTLIFAPLRVIYAVWEREARKWAHTQHLTFSIVHGNEKQRLARLFTDADVYLCNYENMAWMSNILMHYYISQNKPLPFEMVVYDEISRCKNSTSQRIAGETVELPRPNGKTMSRQIKFVGWRKIIPYFKYHTGLTGTPAGNGYVDLHGQYLCIDNGERLTSRITHFREAYCTPDYSGFKYIVHDLGKKWIHKKIADITIEMATEDYIELPPTIFNDIEVELKPAVRQKYEEIENDMFTKLDDGTEIELFNRASVSNKCLQMANGAVYKNPAEPEWSAVHDEKFQALDSIIEEAAGSPVAVSYCFKSDKERMTKRYKSLNPVVVNEVPLSKLPKMIKDWRAGKIKLLIGHPASMGHGVDGLQDFGDIVVWFGLNWSLELYAQMNARFMRQGRDRPLTVHRILCTDTVDIAVKYALENKETDEKGLKDAINKYRAEKGK